MKIYNKVVIAWNEETQRYDKTVHEDSFEYDGPIMRMASQTWVNPHPSLFGLNPNGCLDYSDNLPSDWFFMSDHDDDDDWIHL